MLGDGHVQGFDVVLIGREATAGRPFGTLLGDLRGALKQAGVPVGERLAERVQEPVA
jgi:ribonuclease P protein component